MRIYSDPVVGDVVFRKRKGIRRISIRVHPVKGVSVSVPYLVPFAAAFAFYRLKRDWVVGTWAAQKEKYGDGMKASPEEVDAMRRQAKAELPSRLEALALRYGFTYNKVTIKHNSTNWGSCSTKNNINLNLNIVRLPEPLKDYILLHELSHLRHHDHGKDFHLLLEELCEDRMKELSGKGDVLATEMLRVASGSRTIYPVSRLLGAEIRKYKLL